MKVLEIAHRDVYVTMEFPIREIRMMAALLDKAEITYQAEDEFMKEAVEWLHKKWEPALKWFEENYGDKIDGGRDAEGSESQKINKEVLLG